jgi:hypothetical protein
VREVDQLDDAVHHGVAERNQRDDRSIGEPGDELLDEDLKVGHCVVRPEG